ncbi:MAG: ribonuclease E/G, partial [Microbacterium sp.]
MAVDEHPETAPSAPRDDAAPDEPVVEPPAAEPQLAEPAAVDAPEAQPEPAEASAPETAEPEPEPEAAAEPEPPTAVSLGLLPAEFVSTVSTQLVFYAPEIVPLPPRPKERDEAAASTPSRRRGRRRGGDEDDREAAPAPRQRAVELITEPQRIKGSTRLEAKKQ